MEVEAGGEGEGEAARERAAAVYAEAEASFRESGQKDERVLVLEVREMARDGPRWPEMARDPPSARRRARFRDLSGGGAPN